MQIKNVTYTDPKSYKFADPAEVVKNIKEGNIKKLVIASKEDIKDLLKRGGALNPDNKGFRYLLNNSNINRAEKIKVD